jgi:hypothetical protein
LRIQSRLCAEFECSAFQDNSAFPNATKRKATAPAKLRHTQIDSPPPSNSTRQQDNAHRLTNKGTVLGSIKGKEEKMECEKTKEQFAEDLKVLEDGQAVFQKEFVELKKAKADKAKIDEVLNRLKDGKEKIAALVRGLLRFNCPIHLILIIFI